ncbi:MAG TPA: 50S ribosomal protein L18 [Chitinophagaceae bacterium]|nr:50S ribosomal protein L18 [Chitinophagaceae bacterium]
MKKMNAKAKSQRRQNIRFNIRKKISGTGAKPRLSVFRSNTEIYAQLIDDIQGQTLAAASSKDKEIAAQKLAKADKSKLVGSAIARKATELGIKEVVFDRGGYLYHGRVKSLADGAREGGLQF